MSRAGLGAGETIETAPTEAELASYDLWDIVTELGFAVVRVEKATDGVIDTAAQQRIFKPVYATERRFAYAVWTYITTRDVAGWQDGHDNETAPALTGAVAGTPKRAGDIGDE